MISAFPAILVMVAVRSRIAGLLVFIVLWQCRTWKDLRLILYCCLAALLMRSFLFDPFNIPSGSMKDTLLVGDYLFVSKYSYGYSRYSFPLGLPLFKGRVMGEAPKRGDVVVFRPPGAVNQDYIKRLIGLPGDRIQVKASTVYINGVALKDEPDGTFLDNEDPYQVKSIPRFTETLPEGKVIRVLNERYTASDDTPVFTVPQGHYFMMGDNRDNSADSRVEGGVVGFVPEENLVGRAEIIFFSIDTATLTLNPLTWFSSLRFGRFFDKIE